VGLPLILTYGVIYFFTAAFIAIIHEGEAAREESQKQQAELQLAHQKLQAYTARAEELAVLEERSRLARELHDSVTQSLHSSTLLAEAGQRLAGSGDIERARGYLVRLGEISQQALKEMRLLVYELRPLALSDTGLEGALQQRLDTVERRSGVEVRLSIAQELELPAVVEEELFWIAIEALNNALKHANPTTVTVALRMDEQREIPCIALEIADDGIGFDPDAKIDEGGLGLISMQERVEKLGGELNILSAPGEGTQVRACVELEMPSVSPDSQES
jgi:signal transduction histidine kinase